MIPGISNVRRLPRLGVIRLGEKAISSKGSPYPKALDHFNFKDAPAVAAVYGENCKELDIMFPVEDQDVFFDQSLKAYRKSGLFCRCSDGQTATRVRLGLSDGKGTPVPAGKPYDPVGEDYLSKTGEDVEIGHMFEMPCAYQECEFFKRDLCKGIGRMMFLLPKVPQFGCWQITTSSWNTMVSVNNYIHAIRAAAGRISMIPLKLRLIPQQAQVEGKAKTIHVLEIVYEGTLQSLVHCGMKALPAPTPSAIPVESLKEVPDDMMPHAGAELDAALGIGPKLNPAAAGAVKLDDIPGMGPKAPAATPAPKAPAAASAPKPPASKPYVAGEDIEDNPKDVSKDF